MSKSSRTSRHQQATEYQVEFWTDASGRDCRHRSRYYASAEGMLRAGSRWEARGTPYYCRYWHGLNTWQSSTRTTLTDNLPAIGARGAALVRADEVKPRRPRRSTVKFYSIFGQIERVAAEIMIKDGRARRIPQSEIPQSVLTNEHGDTANFAIMISVGQDQEFDNLCKTLRS
jgi:hypothetical protein